MASTERMLDAAEELIATGGPHGLTIEAVVKRSGCSNGSIYARFGDRLGLLGAVQERFLSRTGELVVGRLEAIDDDWTLDDVLRLLTAIFVETFDDNRNAFIAFMLQTLGEPTFRARGSVATQQASSAVSVALSAASGEIAHPDPNVATDIVFRVLFALATQLVMFDSAEITGTALDRDSLIEETTRLLHTYLTAA